MSQRILHILSQRPSRTGSGVTLDSLVRQATAAGWQQAAVVGVPADETHPAVGDLESEAVHPLYFASGSPERGRPDLDFRVPGMSDVMPYPSSVWSTLGNAELDDYRRLWRGHLARVVNEFQPHLIHGNHIWLVSSLLREIAPAVPIVVNCHATGLRQMQLCPHLAPEVQAGCRRLDHFCTLREDHRRQLADTLGIDPGKITVTGAGFREDLFHPGSESGGRDHQLLYVGKYAAAKGLPWLLDAVERLSAERPELTLHVAGGGAGSEAEALRRRMQDLAPLVRMHGQLDQRALSGLMRKCAVCVLPSFYEGVPLVLVEAAACGCRLVATALPGITEQIQPALGSWLATVPVPGLISVDRPRPADLPVFVDRLAESLARTLDAARNAADPGPDLSRFTWSRVFERVERIWRELA